MGREWVNRCCGWPKIHPMGREQFYRDSSSAMNELTDAVGGQRCFLWVRNGFTETALGQEIG